jgi:hypothetical protein
LLAFLSGSTSSSPARKHASAWHLFLLLVAVATLLPFVLAPLFASLVPQTSSAFLVYSTIAFVGANGHIAGTGWFLTDARMRSHFRARPLRYIVVPCLLIAASSVAYQLLDGLSLVCLAVVFLSWQMWHYQKQNFGLLSFIAAGTDGISLSIWERRTLTLSAVAGILGFFSVVGDIGLNDYSTTLQHLHQIGLALYFVVPLSFAIAVVKSPTLRTNNLRLLFFLIGTLFFLPTFIFSERMAALSGYGIAHGLQYLVFMGCVSAKKRGTLMPLIGLLAIAVIGGLALNLSMDGPRWLYGIYIGVVMTHFVADAGIWRLREPPQRAYMKSKFYFVFER